MSISKKAIHFLKGQFYLVDFVLGMLINTVSHIEPSTQWAILMIENLRVHQPKLIDKRQVHAMQH